MIHIVLPTNDFTTTILFNLTTYVYNHSFTWLLFFKLVTAYHHIGYGVRSLNSLTLNNLHWQPVLLYFVLRSAPRMVNEEALFGNLTNMKRWLIVRN